jgi:hypothetical protein
VRLHQQTVGDRLWMAEGPLGVRIIASAARPEGFKEVPEGVRVLDCFTTRPEGVERVVFVEEGAKRLWPGRGLPRRQPQGAILTRWPARSWRPCVHPGFRSRWAYGWRQAVEQVQWPVDADLACAHAGSPEGRIRGLPWPAWRLSRHASASALGLVVSRADHHQAHAPPRPASAPGG